MKSYENMELYEQKIAVNCLRGLLQFARHRSKSTLIYVGRIAHVLDNLLEALGLHSQDSPLNKLDEKRGRKEWATGTPTKGEIDRLMERGLQSLDLKQRGLRGVRPGVTERAIRVLAQMLRLDHVDTRIFGLLLRRSLGGPFSDMAEVVKDAVNHEIAWPEATIVATLLDVNQNSLDQRIRPSGRLATVGLISVDPDGNISLTKRTLQAYRRIRFEAVDAEMALLGRAVLPEIAWEDFDHIAEHRDHVLRILEGGMRQRAPGVHILLYGPPGTGKTEFCKAVAAHLNVPIYSVGESDDDGGEPTRSERIADYRLYQTLVGASNPALIMFDEAEDLFTGGPTLTQMMGDGRLGGSKAFVHRLLEQAPVPTLWTTNNLDALGSAVLRRMTHAVELRTPPAAVRARIWRRTLSRQSIAISDGEIDRLARGFPAPPSLAAGAVRVAGLTGGGSEGMRRSIAGIAKAMNGGTSPRPVPLADEVYDPALVNAATDLSALADALARPGAGRAFSLCLYGPPGTGKTAYVRYLAARVGMEVLQKRASDLLSMWLGGTEKGIAAAFEEARSCGMFLVFDEADSLLQDRGGAMRSWEITQVNEMLTWMECHDLPFACTTNLMERLDAAALRRFSFKLRLDYLAPNQRRRAFRAFFSAEPPPSVDELDRLAPGDFAVVRRRASILGCLGDANCLATMLGEECQAKPGGAGPIGFRIAE